MTVPVFIALHAERDDGEWAVRVENAGAVSRRFRVEGFLPHVIMSCPPEMLDRPYPFDYMHYETRPFCRGAMFNHAIRELPNYPAYLFGEADCLIQDTHRCLNAAIKHGWSWGWTDGYYLNKAERAALLETFDGSWPREYSRDNVRRYGYKGTEGGLIGIRADVLETLNGFDEYYTDLGGLDNEVVVRLKRVHRGVGIKQDMIHLWHPQSPLKQLRGNTHRLGRLKVNRDVVNWRVWYDRGARWR